MPKIKEARWASVIPRTLEFLPTFLDVFPAAFRQYLRRQACLDEDSLNFSENIPSKENVPPNLIEVAHSSVNEPVAHVVPVDCSPTSDVGPQLNENLIKPPDAKKPRRDVLMPINLQEENSLMALLEVFYNLNKFKPKGLIQPFIITSQNEAPLDLNNGTGFDAEIPDLRFEDLMADLWDL